MVATPDTVRAANVICDDSKMKQQFWVNELYISGSQMIVGTDPKKAA